MIRLEQEDLAMLVVRDSEVIREEIRRKRELRAADERAVASGEKSPAQVKARNSHFERFEVRVKLELSKLVP
jgi:hypothetical protein